jgi:hypothetical protein
VSTQGWDILQASEEIRFYLPPATGAAISVQELPRSGRNATDIWAIGAFSAVNGYPAEVEFYADRLIFAATGRQPQTLWMSQTGNYSAFGKSVPGEDTDSIAVTLNARQVNTVLDLVPLESLVLMTTGGEWRTSTGQSEVIAPTTVGFKPQSYFGSARVPAIVIGNTALFVQQRGYIVRDLAYQFESDGYTGSDLTVFSQHLLEEKPIVEWAYQQTPYSTVWCVRDDGVLLSLTYMRDQQVVGWTQHQTDGFVESVCVVPEALEDAVYLTVRRTVGGQQRRYVERLSTRIVSNAAEGAFMDSHLTFRGKRTDSVALRLSRLGSGGWTNNDVLQLTADFGTSSVFNLTDIGDHIWVEWEGRTLRLAITEYIDAASVRVQPLRDVPTTLRVENPADQPPLVGWSFARDTIAGLSHLEGREVAILADGFVQARKTVTGGAVTLESPGTIVHVGLPYVAEVETLEINAGMQESTKPRNKRINRVSLVLQDTRSIKAGTTRDRLEGLEPRSLFDDYQAPPALKQETWEAWISGTFEKAGRVIVRQEDPLPMTLLAIIPEVTFGE